MKSVSKGAVFLLNRYIINKCFVNKCKFVRLLNFVYLCKNEVEPTILNSLFLIVFIITFW